MQNICKGSIERVTKCTVSVETVGLCTGNVRNKEDRLFLVSLLPGQQHTEAEMVWSSPQQFIEEKERDREGGEVERGLGYGKRMNKWKNGRSEVCFTNQANHFINKRVMRARDMTRVKENPTEGFSVSTKSHISSSQLLKCYSNGAFICSQLYLKAERDARLSVS